MSLKTRLKSVMTFLFADGWAPLSTKIPMYIGDVEAQAPLIGVGSSLSPILLLLRMFMGT